MLILGAWQSADGIKDSSRVFQSEHFFSHYGKFTYG